MSQLLVHTEHETYFTTTYTDVTGRNVSLSEGLSYFDILRLNKGIVRRGAGFPAAYVFNVPAGDNTLIYRIPESEEQGNSLISASDNNPVTSIPSPVTDN